ncbi:MAG: hypothetical protein GY838_02870 [bacterium]|nr:hypothetical protein [bacterium]
MKRYLGLSAVLAACLMLAGCGVYSASSGRVDESIRNVAVQYLDNRTNEPNIGVDLTDAIILALQTDNTLRVVDEGAADSIVSGRVLRYHMQEMAARGEDLTVNQYQVQIVVVLDFTVRATGETIFKEKRFNGAGTYVLDDPTGLTSEQSAKEEAGGDIVKDILALVVEDW